MPAGSDSQLGMAAAVFTSVLWTATALLFTAAGRRISPGLVNASRIFLAIAMLAVTHRVLAGTWWPEAVLGQVVLLGLSGVIGLSIGDHALFIAFVAIGPRLSMLIMTTSPIFAVALGWAALGETVTVGSAVGIALTVGGVAWVILERPHGRDKPVGNGRLRGLLLAFLAAGCQAGGLLLSKQGMGHGWLPDEMHMAPQAATFVRMAFAGVGVIPFLIWRRAGSIMLKRKKPISTTRPPATQWRSGYLLAACGAVVGPYLGVWMSLVAADHTTVGVAQTLCSLSPVLILPFATIVYRERVSAHAVFGAFMSVVGVTVLLVWR